MPRQPKADIPAVLRWEVWERDDFRCHYCGSRRRLVIDHVIPESQGGETVAGNLVTACGRCNGKKGVRDYEEFWHVLDIEWAIRHVLKSKNNGVIFLDDETVREVSKLATMREYLRTNPDVVMIDDGKSFGFISGMSADVFKEVIAERRSCDLHAEAERLLSIARERFGPDFSA